MLFACVGGTLQVERGHGECGRLLVLLGLPGHAGPGRLPRLQVPGQQVIVGLRTANLDARFTKHKSPLEKCKSCESYYSVIRDMRKLTAQLVEELA